MLTFFLTQDKARKEKEAKVRAEQERKEREEAAAREREEEKRRQKEMEQVGPHWLLACCVYVPRLEYCRLDESNAACHKSVGRRTRNDLGRCASICVAGNYHADIAEQWRHICCCQSVKPSSRN
jgi:sRNA-binding protein